MKKFVIAAVLIIAVAGVGTPLVRGFMLERIIKQSIGDINQMYAATGSDVVIEIQQYDINFSSSRIEWKIKLGRLSALYTIQEIVFIERVNHGFANTVSETSLEKNKWFTDFVNNELDGKNPLEIKTEYRLSGEIRSNITWDDFSFTADIIPVEIMPGNIVIMLDKGVENFLSEMTWKGCLSPGKFQIDDFSLNSKLKKITPYIWDGIVSFTVKNIHAAEKDKVFDLSNLKSNYTLDYSGKDHSLSIGTGYGVDTVKSGQDIVKNASVQIFINQIDAKGYEELVKLYSQMMGRAAEQIAAAGDTMEKILEKQMAALGLQLHGVFENLLKKGLEIHISDLRAQLPQGNIHGDVSLSLKKDMTLAEFIPLMMNPSLALDVFSLKSEATLPDKLAGDNQALLLAPYSGMQTGLFVKDGDNLTHKAETKEGKLFLNGREVLLN